MTPRFEKAYNALLNAFTTDTIGKGSCTSCAVGNIVGDAMGGRIYRTVDNRFKCTIQNDWWSDLFVTSDDSQTIYLIKDNPVVKKYRERIYELTGYKWNELAKVEKTFELNTQIRFTDYVYYRAEDILKDQYNGLISVMDVLIKLDNIPNGEQYKDNFKKILEKKLVDLK